MLADVAVPSCSICSGCQKVHARRRSSTSEAGLSTYRVAGGCGNNKYIWVHENAMLTIPNQKSWEHG
jgi:hypothetical protein